MKFILGHFYKSLVNVVNQSTFKISLANVKPLVVDTRLYRRIYKISPKEINI